MPINHPTSAPNGAPIKHHVIRHVVITPQGSRAVIDSYNAENLRVIWHDDYALDPNTDDWSIASAEAWLVSPAGPFAGGTIVGTVSPFDQLRAELIALAARRRRELRKIYVHDFGGEIGSVPFDCDEASSGNILAIVAGPVLAGDPAPAPVLYKCADDVYRTFEYADFRTMAFGLSAYVQALHARERELIELINAAEDVTALNALRETVATYFAPPPEPAEP